MEPKAKAAVMRIPRPQAELETETTMESVRKPVAVKSDVDEENFCCLVRCKIE